MEPTKQNIQNLSPSRVTHRASKPRFFKYNGLKLFGTKLKVNITIVLSGSKNHHLWEMILLFITMWFESRYYWAGLKASNEGLIKT